MWTLNDYLNPELIVFDVYYDSVESAKVALGLRRMKKKQLKVAKM